MFGSNSPSNLLILSNQVAPKNPSAPEFDPNLALSFEFIWNGVHSVNDSSEIVGMGIKFDQINRYEVQIPQSSADPTTPYLINFKKLAIDTDGRATYSDYIKVAQVNTAQQIKIYAKLFNRNKNTALQLLESKLTQAVPSANLNLSEERIKLDLSGLRPGRHYLIHVSHPKASSDIQAVFVDKGPFRTVKKRSELKEEKTPAASPNQNNLLISPKVSGSSIQSKVDAAQIALSNTDLHLFDPRFGEIIDFGQKLLGNLTTAKILDEHKAKQINIIFLGTLVSAYAFERWKQFGDNDFESLYFWLIETGMDRIIIGSRQESPDSPYRNVNHSVYDVSKNPTLYLRMIMVIGNQLMNSVHPFNLELYSSVFPTLNSELIEITNSRLQEAPVGFFEMQENIIAALIMPHLAIRALNEEQKASPPPVSSTSLATSAPLKSASSSSASIFVKPQIVISVEDKKLLIDKLAPLFKTPLSSAILKLRTRLLSAAAQKASLFSEQQMQSLKKVPTEQELEAYLREACSTYINNFSPAELKAIHVIAKYNPKPEQLKEAVFNLIEAPKLAQFAEEVLRISTPTASSELIKAAVAQFTKFVATHEGEMAEFTDYLNSSNQLKDMSKKI